MLSQVWRGEVEQHWSHGLHSIGAMAYIALEPWLTFGWNGLLAVLRQDGVDVVGIGR